MLKNCYYKFNCVLTNDNSIIISAIQPVRFVGVFKFFLILRVCFIILHKIETS